MLAELPDGIHSGLAREGERGIFFYFTAPAEKGGGRRHFWRYYDLIRNRTIDNRFLITNFIACSPDTPRVIGDADVFAIQEKVIEDILHSVEEQQAVEAAPKVLDPLQQTVITLLRGYLNSPTVERNDVRRAMHRLRQPMTHAAIRDLRQAYHKFQMNHDIQDMLRSVDEVESGDFGLDTVRNERYTALTREDLHLVCFDFVWG